MHRDGGYREARPGDGHTKMEVARRRADESTNQATDGRRPQSNLMQQVRDTGGAIVNDLRLGPKNSFLDGSLVDEQTQQSSRIRSCSAPGSSFLSEISERSSSSLNSAQQKMMATSSSSSGSKPLILRGPPSGRQDTDRDSGDDAFTMSHPGGTCSNSVDSDSDDIHDSERSFVEAVPAESVPADQYDGAQAPPSAADDEDRSNPVPQVSYSQLPSFGSVGHASGRCTPCTFARGTMTCRKAWNCNYCHFPHPKGPSPSKQTRPCKEKRLRQKKQMERIYVEFERDPEGFDVEGFAMPASLLNTSLETELKEELRRRRANLQSHPRGTGASSSSSRVPLANFSTRCSL